MSAIKEISFSRFDDQRWVVSTPNQNHVLINPSSKRLLEILRDAIDEHNALSQFNEEFNQSLNQEEFGNFIQEKFTNQDILLSDTQPFRKNTYLSLKLKLFNPRIAGLMAFPLSWMFSPSLFWILFVSAMTFLVWLSYSFFTFTEIAIDVDDIFTYTGLLYLTMLIHELGHIAACRKFGIDHGEIGFGFYLAFPVLYADVTNIWKLDRHKRIITNLGGIYLELLYSLAIGGLFMMTDNVI
ncbi:MAG: hypothetical protein RIA63_12045, partial [Cyclobacteriaceae bacterium]